jgi:hypothetical protein
LVVAHPGNKIIGHGLGVEGVPRDGPEPRVVFYFFDSFLGGSVFS